MTTDTTLQDLADSIKKNLPAHVGDALQGELAALKKLRDEEPKKAEQLADLQQRLAQESARVTAFLAEAGKATERENAVSKREADVLAREQRVNLNELELRLTREHQKEILGVVNTVFRSPVFTRSIGGSVPVPVEGNPGNPNYGHSPSAGFVSQGSLSLDETIRQG